MLTQRLFRHRRPNQCIYDGARGIAPQVVFNFSKCVKSVPTIKGCRLICVGTTLQAYQVCIFVALLIFSSLIRDSIVLYESDAAL